MTCRPARIKSAMNGEVFQTSAMMITISAWGSDPSQTVFVPRIVLMKPYGETNIVRHMVAVTTVSTAHGTSTTVRSSPCPRKASCIASAAPVGVKAGLKRGGPRGPVPDGGVVDVPPPPAPPEGKAPATLTLYSCR